VDKNLIGLGVFLLLAGALFSYSRVDWAPESRVAARLREVYELSNPGYEVTNLTLTRDDGFFRVTFNIDGELFLVYLDRSGKYLLPIRTDLEETIDILKNQEKFFTCLRDLGIVLYGQIGTNATEEQFFRLDYSPYIDYIYVDCPEEDPQPCIDRNVTEVPTWEINGTLYIGSASIDNLALFTGCTW
jgi:hypothetical protein